MKNSVRKVFGAGLVLVGIVWALFVLEVVSFDFSLRGWWAFFVIVPCAVNLFFDKDKIGSAVGVVLGVLLFLAARDVITWDMYWKLGLALIVVSLGLHLLFHKRIAKAQISDFEVVSRDGKAVRVVECSFGRQSLSLSGEKFEGADLKTSFCSFSLDLREAVVEQDVDIRLDAGFCGVEIICPEKCVVKCSVSSGFGGVKDTRYSKGDPGAPVIFITGSIGFGGLEIK